MSWSRTIKFWGVFCCSLILIFSNYGAKALAQERVFLNLGIEFLGEYKLQQTSYKDTKIGGWSGITYNPLQDRYYVISDDRSVFSPARFYTLKIDIDTETIKDIVIENVTYLKDDQGNNYPANTIDTEGITFSPRQTLFISSEGITEREIPPFIQEFDLKGNWLKTIPIPERYLPQPEEKKGIENNLGFESLTIKTNGFMNQEPFRLFVATESALTQDIDLDNPETFNRSRLMHYVINPFGSPILVAEHLYLMDSPAFGTLYHGMSELLALPQEGYLLSLERSFGMGGYSIKLFQIVMGNASDIANQTSLPINIDNIVPIKKQLLLDLAELDVELDNLEGLTLGPRLPDGSQSLILVSDNNFAEEGEQKNQFLLFKLKGLSK